jgi:hypothetical protein
LTQIDVQTQLQFSVPEAAVENGPFHRPNSRERSNGDRSFDYGSNFRDSVR